MAIKDRDQAGTGTRYVTVDSDGLHGSSSIPTLAPASGFAAFAAAIGSTALEVVVAVEVAIPATLDFAALCPNASVRILQGGSFNVASGQTLTIPEPEAGLYQIYSGLGLVRYSKAEKVLPEHWGATGDGTTDDTAAIQAAIDCAYEINATMQFRPTTYRATTIAKEIDSARYIRIRGAGMSSTVIRKIGAGTDPVLNLNSVDLSPPPYLENFTELSDFKILGTSKAHHGIQLTRMALCKIDRVNVVDCDYGVNNVGSLLNNWFSCRFVSCNRGFVTSRATGTSSVYSNVVNFYGCRFKGNSVFGLDAGGGNNIYLAGCEFDNNGENANTGTGAVIVRATTDDEFGFGILNFDTTWFEGNDGRTFQTESTCGAFISIKNSQFVGNETGGSARAIYVPGARGIYLDNVCAGGPNDVVEITSNVSKSDVRNSTIATLTDNCQDKNHFNLNDTTGIARGFSTDLFVSRSAKIKIAVNSTFGNEHEISNDGSNRLNFGAHNGAGFRFDGGPLVFADGGYNQTHIAFGNNRIWKDASGELRMKTSAPGAAADGYPLGQISTTGLVALMSNESSGEVVLGSNPATADYAYSAKNDSEQSFTVAAMVPKFVPVPNYTFTIGANTYTVLKWDRTKVYVYEDISGEAAAGTLTGVRCVPVFLRILSTGRIEFPGATGDNNVKINAPAGSYPILEFREGDASGTAWQQYKHPTTDDMIIWGGSEHFRIARSGGDITAVTGNLIANTVGKGLRVKAGTNGRINMGNVLVAGTVTVANTSVTANTLITWNRVVAGGTLGNITITRNAGVGYTITSDSATETSTIDVMLTEAT